MEVFTGQAWKWYKHSRLHFHGQNSDTGYTYLKGGWEMEWAQEEKETSLGNT